MNDEFPYRRLAVYGKSKDYVKFIYELLCKFPIEERYALCDQLRRASVSICSNIAEGVSRYSGKEEVHFIEMAYGSLNGTMCQLEIAFELNYINSQDVADAEMFYTAISRMLSGLRRSIISRS